MAYSISIRLRGQSNLLKRIRPGDPPSASCAAAARSDGLPSDASSSSACGCVYEHRLRLHPEARERPWLVLGGPALRMHTQPSAAPGRAKLTQLCWAPPVATLVEHYTGCAHSCEEVLHAAGNFNWADVAEDPLEVLSEHFDIEAEAPWLDSDGGTNSDGDAYGWAAGEVRALYKKAGDAAGCAHVEHVAPAWWVELVAAVCGGHPTYLLCERLEAVYVRLANQRAHGDDGQGRSHSHCLLVVGVEGAGGIACTSNRRGGAPRLLLKDPCCEERDRLIEATFEAEAGVATVGWQRVQLRALHANGRGVESRYRVRGSVRFARAPPPPPQQQQAAEAVIAAEAMLGVADSTAAHAAAVA